MVPLEFRFDLVPNFSFFSKLKTSALSFSFKLTICASAQLLNSLQVPLRRGLQWDNPTLPFFFPLFAHLLWFDAHPERTPNLRRVQCVFLIATFVLLVFETSPSPIVFSRTDLLQPVQSPLTFTFHSVNPVSPFF